MTDHGANGRVDLDRAFEARRNAAVPQDDDTVGKPAYIGGLVGYIDDGDTACAQPFDNAEELFRFTCGEAGGRFVEQHDGRAMADGTRYRDQLLVGQRHLGELRIEVDVQADPFGALLRAAAHIGGRGHQRARAGAEEIQQQVFRDAERRDTDVGDGLVNGDDAAFLRLCGRCDIDGAALDFDRAGIRPLNAAEDFDQRRLACAIGAHQRDDFPGMHIQIDRTQRSGRAVGLVDRAQPQSGRDRPRCRHSRTPFRAYRL